MMIKVLIVDDSETMRRVLKYYLENAGHLVQEAVDGLQAWKSAQEKRFDLIITDINMPNMDGFEFIEKVRGESQNMHTPILTVTTEGAQGKKMRGKEVGASGWITKPFHENTILQAIKRLVS